MVRIFFHRFRRFPAVTSRIDVTPLLTMSETLELSTEIMSHAAASYRNL